MIIRLNKKGWGLLKLNQMHFALRQSLDLYGVWGVEYACLNGNGLHRLICLITCFPVGKTAWERRCGLTGGGTSLRVNLEASNSPHHSLPVCPLCLLLWIKV